VFLRKSGKDDDDARDLVQAFCAQLLERGGLDGVDRTVGRFRHYLLGALRHFAANAQRAERTQRRGGLAVTWSLDDAVDRYLADGAATASPEAAFDRRWALDLLARATARLRAEYATPAKAALLLELEPALLGDGTPHADVAARLHATAGAVRVALHRLRRRRRERGRDEVAQTLADARDPDDGLRALFGALGPAQRGAARIPGPAGNDGDGAGSWPGEP